MKASGQGKRKSRKPATANTLIGECDKKFHPQSKVGVKYSSLVSSIRYTGADQCCLTTIERPDWRRLLVKKSHCPEPDSTSSLPKCFRNRPQSGLPPFSAKATDPKTLAAPSSKPVSDARFDYTFPVLHSYLQDPPSSSPRASICKQWRLRSH